MHSRRILLVPALALVLCACRDSDGARTERAPPPAGAPSAGAEGGVLHGTVVQLSEDALEVRPAAADEPSVTLRIVPGIPIVVDGRVSAWSEIPEGAQVRAEWILERGAPVAVRVEASTGPGPSRR